MGDFLILMLSAAMILFFVLAGIEYAKSKSSIILICLVFIVFSAVFAWMITVNENKIPVEKVEKAWNEYAQECKEQHISWSELTFPEWLNIKASE